ncbi:MAG: UvrB/UvrC motif-containing protein [Lachnospira sp.]|nr:UvrB/UvrC motif-containing protein [Lachnospira sp.]
MLCENCHQNEASIHYTEIINGVKREHYLCMECARKLNFSGLGDMSDTEFPFVRLLTGLLSAGGGGKELEDSPMMHVCCPGCGMSFDEFTMVGKFGCAECYGVFAPLIEDNMKRIHGDSVHRGKKYKSGSGDMPVSGERNDNTLAIMKDENDDPVETLKELNRKLREAVEIENFEEAAKLRDKIIMLKSSSRINRNEEQGGGQDA